MDLTPEDIKILHLAASAFLGAGDPIGGDIEANLPVVLGLIAADPRFRAGVLAAYRAGREDVAKEERAKIAKEIEAQDDLIYAWQVVELLEGEDVTP